MGAKTWMLVLCDADPKQVLMSAPVLDRAATIAMAARLFPGETLTPLPDGSLDDTCPPDGELVIGSFAGLTIVAAKEFGIDYPSRLALPFITAMPATFVYLHAMHSVADWFGYAIWKDGQLQRALSLSSDDGVIEDVGARLPFEEAFWDGTHPSIDPEYVDQADPVAFHPLDLAEEALFSLFGYRLEGEISKDVDPETITVMRFRRA